MNKFQKAVHKTTKDHIEHGYGNYRQCRILSRIIVQIDAFGFHSHINGLENSKVNRMSRR